VNRILAIHSEPVRPDTASGDRRFAAFLRCLEEQASVDLLQESVDNPEADAEGIALLRGYFAGRLLPGGYRGLVRALYSGIYAVCLIEFWHVAERLIPIIRRTQPWARVVVDSVDIHFVREAGAVGLGLLDRGIAAENMRRELDTYRAADAVITVTEDDRQALNAEGVSVPIFVVPNIIASTERQQRVRQKELLFIGGFRHQPNADGLIWFVNECWASVRRSVPDAVLTVAGSNPTAEVRALAEIDGVHIEGHVPDTSPYLDRAAVSIAPLRYGSGMKGKVCEAMAGGIPLVSTSVGVAGIPVRHLTDAWVADDPQGFADGVIECLRNTPWAESMGRQGRAVIEKVCGISAVSAQVNTLLSTMGGHKPRQIERFWWLCRGLLSHARCLARDQATRLGARRIKAALARRSFKPRAD
jgi:O-antigen biosynthesis protein